MIGIKTIPTLIVRPGVEVQVCMFIDEPVEWNIAEDPLRCVARGTGIALKNVAKLPFLIKN